ncbi:hypothetical protein CASFOL_023057 [Castilleja foliolosa]|uniref:DNL-type domain-containing protein n=1 Tax=Castilleja foliolosa TaxID=1961234 RepID=A0ABD3CJH6_9LAMI
MAARRIISLISAKTPQNLFPREISRKFDLSPNSFSRRYEQYIRGFQSIPEATTQTVENQVKPETHTSISNISTTDSSSSSSSSTTHQVSSNLKVSERHDLAMVFTCKVCDVRSVKTVCRESYEKGVVVARCDGCNSLHLIADRLGWFGEPSSVEDFLAARGEEVKKGSIDTLNLTLEDLAGKNDILNSCS